MIKHLHKISSVLLVSVFLNLVLGSTAGLSADSTADLLNDSRRISMDFDNAPVKEVLKIFSQQSGLNFITNKDIEDKTVTVYFENVSVKDALNSIMNANNFSYYAAEGSDIFVVYASDTSSPPLVTKVFKLKYTRLSVSPIDVAGQRTVTDLLKSDIPTITTTASSTSSSALTSSTSQSVNEKSSVQKGVDQLVASLLSEQGKLTIDIPTNSIVVTDTPEQLRRIEEVIEKVDVPTPQVLLEVFVMEVKKDLINNIGIDWGGSDGALFNFTGATSTTSSPFGTHFFKKRLGLHPAIADNTVTLGSVGGANFAATLRFIKDNKDTKVLAQPRVLTLNNEAATIQLVSNSGIAITNVTVTTGAAPVTTATVERAQLGISLKMTPQIDFDDTIQLFIEPAVTTAVRNTELGSTATILDPTTRIIRTIARVRDRQTLVIGGLVDNNKFNEKKRIPGLGDLPIFGKAFQYEKTNNADREILIFITPRILKAQDASFGKDLAVKRMLDNFSREEMGKKMNAAENFGENSISIPVQKTAVSHAQLRPALEEEMDKSMDAFNPKPIKLNR